MSFSVVFYLLGSLLFCRKFFLKFLNYRHCSSKTVQKRSVEILGEQSLPDHANKILNLMKDALVTIALYNSMKWGVLFAFIGFGWFGEIQRLLRPFVANLWFPEMLEALLFFSVLCLLPFGSHMIREILGNIITVRHYGNQYRLKLKSFAHRHGKYLKASIVSNGIRILLITGLVGLFPYWWVCVWMILALVELLVQWWIPIYLKKMGDHHSPLPEGPLKEKIKELLKNLISMYQECMYRPGASIR